MVDLDFIAQYLVLREAPANPALWHRSARQVFEAAQAHGLLEASITQPLMDAKEFLSDLMSLLRLSAPGGLITDEAPPGLKTLLVQGMHLPSFSALKEQVLFHEARVMRIVEAMQRGEL